MDLSEGILYEERHPNKGRDDGDEAIEEEEPAEEEEKGIEAKTVGTSDLPEMTVPQ